jgi:hypothetical protein
MFDAGIDPEHVDSVVAGLGFAVSALGASGPAAWSLFDLATAVEPERRSIALAAVREQARASGCGASLDYALTSCRRLVRSSACLRDHPDIDTVLLAVDCAVAAALMAGRIEPEVAVVLTAPQRALTRLLGGLDAPSPVTVG